MAQFLNAGTVGSSSLYSWIQVADEARCDLSNPRFNWNYQLRCKESAGYPASWQELWPLPRIASGDPTASLALLGQDVSEGGRYEYPSTISRGMARPWFFRGTCKDGNGNPLGGTEVTAYLASNDQPVGQALCDDRGIYECPTSHYGVAHYLVARYASGNLAGSTVDTLTPAL